MPSKEYWAGLFDGEGHVSISNEGRIQVGVAQKGRMVLDLLSNDFGGKVSKTNRDQHKWRVCGKIEIVPFLEAISPYSIVKKKEIDVALQLSRMLHERNGKENTGCIPLSEEEFRERMRLRALLQEIRPKKTFLGLTSKHKQYRDEVKEKAGYKCELCGKDLKDERKAFQVIRDGKLMCKGCLVRVVPREIKAVTEEEVRNAIMESKNLREAAKKVGLCKSSFIVKRRKLGLLQPFGGKRRIDSLQKQITQGHPKPEEGQVASYG